MNVALTSMRLTVGRRAVQLRDQRQRERPGAAVERRQHLPSGDSAIPNGFGAWTFTSTPAGVTSRPFGRIAALTPSTVVRSLPAVARRRENCRKSEERPAAVAVRRREYPDSNQSIRPDHQRGHRFVPSNYRATVSSSASLGPMRLRRRLGRRGDITPWIVGGCVSCVTSRCCRAGFAKLGMAATVVLMLHARARLRLRTRVTMRR